MKKTLKISLLIMICFKVNGQVDLIGHLSNSAYYVGWNNLSSDNLNIEHRGTADINFLLGTTQYVAIKGTAYAIPGAVGIGTTSPSNKLTVSGNADVTGNLGIGVATPRTALDVNGTITAKQIIIENNNSKQDLLALVLKLQNEIDELKQQLSELLITFSATKN